VIDKQAIIREEYDRWHSLAEETSDPGEERHHAWVLGLLAAPKGAALLDVACGRGGFLAYAAEQGLQVAGVDISPVAIEAAARRLGPEADLHVAPGESLPFADDSFAYLTCLGSLEHFADPLQGVREIARVLRPGGTALVLVPNLFFLGHVWFGLRHGTQPSEGEQDFSETFRSTQGWRQLLEEGGLEIRALHTWNHVFASPKVRPITMRIWNALARFVPTHGSLHLVFVCSPPDTNDAGRNDPR